MQVYTGARYPSITVQVVHHGVHTSPPGLKAAMSHHTYAPAVQHHQVRPKTSQANMAVIAVWIGVSALYQYVVSLNAVVAFAWSAVTAAAAGAVIYAVRATWPRPVPPELAEEFAKLQRDGWRRALVHPWWKCDEKRPHTHLVHREDHSPLVLIWGGHSALDGDTL